MAAFLEDIAKFYGTGMKNEDGLTLEEFLEAYNPNEYENPCSTTDILVVKYNSLLSQVREGLEVLMIQRRNHPSIGFWALPGGFAEVGEDLIDGAKRELREETGLTDIPIEQVYTWGETWRDPRTRIITTQYIAVVDETVSKVEAGDDAADAIWLKACIRPLGTKEVLENGIKKNKERYELILTNEEREIELRAIVERTEKIGHLLREENYQVLISEGIAFDHGRFILKGLLYLEGLLAGGK